MMTSGSKGEGLDLNGSNFDAMIIVPNFKVYQSESEIQGHCFAIPLIMNTEETQPCFTQLWSLNHNIKTFPNVFEKHHRGYVLSSELFKLCYKNFSDVKFPALYSAKIHGPCISDKNDTLDIAWFNTYNEEQLTTILTNLYEQGIHWFPSSETLHDLQSYSYESTESIISRFLQQIMPIFCAIRTNGRTDRVLRLYNFLHISRTALSRVLFAFQISEASALVPEITQYSFSSGNKHNYSR
ncbi:unnamed protein product [Mytilus coruscus]|uniref:Mab-21-like nucleotidyltransferase domain-containing protein n=1 Tax=Mytilus coruscus TaxID=42192 RepID=A0A6J8AQS9_MYTCO|nr:unnamed protein product [Mytilus coruscus]